MELDFFHLYGTSDKFFVFVEPGCSGFELQKDDLRDFPFREPIEHDVINSLPKKDHILRFVRKIREKWRNFLVHFSEEHAPRSPKCVLTFFFYVGTSQNAAVEVRGTDENDYDNQEQNGFLMGNGKHGKLALRDGGFRIYYRLFTVFQMIHAILTGDHLLKETLIESFSLHAHPTDENVWQKNELILIFSDKPQEKIEQAILSYNPEKIWSVSPGYAISTEHRLGDIVLPNVFLPYDEKV